MRLPAGNLNFLSQIGRAAAMPVQTPQIRTPWGLDVPLSQFGGGQLAPQPAPAAPRPQMPIQNQQAMLMQLLRNTGRGARY